MAIEPSGSRTHISQENGFADQLRKKMSGALSQQKDQATQSLGGIIDVVRSAGRQLGENNRAGVAGYVNNAADSLERWTDTLQNKDVAEIVEDIQRFGRRQPALFIGLSLGAGLLGARFLKSSRSGWNDSSYQRASMQTAGADRDGVSRADRT